MYVSSYLLACLSRDLYLVFVVSMYPPQPSIILTCLAPPLPSRRAEKLQIKAWPRHVRYLIPLSTTERAERWQIKVLTYLLVLKQVSKSRPSACHSQDYSRLAIACLHTWPSLPTCLSFLVYTGVMAMAMATSRALIHTRGQPPRCFGSAQSILLIR